tara:strand:- start:358 stop:483 length:126 start_codon:yes stop_codon:yes gene_type:complete
MNAVKEIEETMNGHKLNSMEKIGMLEIIKLHLFKETDKYND